jgi:hypothetical protein
MGGSKAGSVAGSRIDGPRPTTSIVAMVLGVSSALGWENPADVEVVASPVCSPPGMSGCWLEPGVSTRS